jgi:hypothetical protein
MAESVGVQDASITWSDGTVSDASLVTIAISPSEVATLLAGYTPSSSTSPSSAVSRTLARLILDALIEAGA